MRESQTTLGVQKEIGRRVRDARVAAGMTQEEAALAAGIDHKRWQRLEQGSVNATVRTLGRMADALGMTFWALVGAAPPVEEQQRTGARPRR